MKYREWSAFWLLGLIWGSSFLWIKIAVQEVGPLVLVGFRLLFGVVGLLALMIVRREPFPSERRVLLGFLFMAVFNTALPFALISWGETRIDSALASILNGTTPLFSIVIAHFWMHEERINLARILGLAIGFSGVIVLVGLEAGSLVNRSVTGELAVLLAAFSYALAANFSRKYLRGQSPLTQAAMVVLFADALSWMAAFTIERPLLLPGRALTWLALAWLGLLGSCLAYILYFYLINAWGATRAATVTYVFPVVGVILGILFLGEPANSRLLLGTLLIVTGIGILNYRFRSRQRSPIPYGTAARGD